MIFCRTCARCAQFELPRKILSEREIFAEVNLVLVVVLICGQKLDHEFFAALRRECTEQLVKTSERSFDSLVHAASQEKKKNCSLFILADWLELKVTGVLVSEVSWPNWVFGTIGPLDRQRESMSHEFFNDPEALPTDCVALVREGIQNSLDQRVDPSQPVRISITAAQGSHSLNASAAQQYFNGLKPHLDSLGVPTNILTEQCNYLVFEDFNTTGLRGDPTVNHDDDPNDFLYFFRVEGKSNKQSHKERGKWGIGKFVFPKASKISTFFGYSVRQQDTYGDGKGLLFGQATLAHHTIGQDSFIPDGWWGQQDHPGEIVKPIASSFSVEAFRNDWNVKRTPDQSGLSIVIPYLAQSDDWSAKNIARTVIEDYFSPILRGQIIVDVHELGGDSFSLTADSLEMVIGQVFDDSRPEMLALREDVFADVAAMKWADSAAAQNLEFTPAQRPSWNDNNYFQRANLNQLRATFESDGKIKVRVPITVKTGDEVSPSYFDVVLVEEPENKKIRPLFIRQGLLVKQATNTRIPGVRVIALFDDHPVSSFLGNAESVAHTSWSHDTRAFKEASYDYGASWLSFIKHAPERLLEKLRGDLTEPDNAIAEEFFPMPGTKRGGPPPPPPPPSRPRSASINKIQGGFSISINPQTWTASSLTVRAAYDVRRGNAFAKWVQEDFSLNAATTSLSIHAVGCEARVDGNKFELTNINADNFKLSVTGFDLHRDLRVEVLEVSEREQ